MVGELGAIAVGAQTQPVTERRKHQQRQGEKHGGSDQFRAAAKESCHPESQREHGGGNPDDLRGDGKAHVDDSKRAGDSAGARNQYHDAGAVGEAVGFFVGGTRSVQEEGTERAQDGDEDERPGVPAALPQGMFGILLWMLRCLHVSKTISGGSIFPLRLRCAPFG